MTSRAIPLPLSGRVALVTGGGRGIGRAISLALGADGADLAINYRSDRESAEETAQELRSTGRRAECYPASVDVIEDNRTMVGSVLDDFGYVDIFVSNAGIASRGQSVVKTDPAELERVMRTHALGPHQLCQELVPSMRERPRGDVVLVSSANTATHPPGGAPYNMAKSALESLGFTLAKEELRNNIRVNLVAPGLVDTTMGQKLVKAVAGVDDIRTLDASMPFGHVCTPDDVANVVRWLVGPQNSYVTGQRITVDGLAASMR